MNLNQNLDLSGHITKEMAEQLSFLPCFLGKSDVVLCMQAEEKLRRKRKVVNRITAMLVIAGTRFINHPDLQYENVRVGLR